MGISDKERNDRFAGSVRRCMNLMMELYDLPRKSWKSVDLRIFEGSIDKISEIVKNCQMSVRKERLKTDLPPQDVDEEGAD